MAGLRHDPILALLLALFMAVGAISAYYLVRGLRIGRIGLRFYHRTFPDTPRSDGRERGYAYRDLSPSLFWTEIGMQVLAVGVSILMVALLLMAP